MATQYTNTGKIFKIIETDDINKISYSGGQYIILDDGMVYYDPTFGTSLKDRVCITPKQEVDINDRGKDSTGQWLSDEYYLSLCTNPIDEDINIIRTQIDGTNKKEYVIYIYNNGKWHKMNESYNAKNVYLDEDIPLTIDFGDKQLINGQSKFNTKGLSVYDALSNIFGPESEPKITQPSIELTVNPPSGEYEIGSVIDINYTLNLNPGKYEFGPDTNVSPTRYRVISKDGIVYYNKTDVFHNVTINDSNYYIDVFIDHIAGDIPNTNKQGGTFPEGQIKAGTIYKRFDVYSGYKNNIYYGCLDQTILDNDKIKDDFDFDIIKTLNTDHFSNDEESKSIELIVPINTRSVIFAIDTDICSVDTISNKETNYNMLSAFYPAGTCDNLTNGNYYLYAYCPANPYSKETKLVINYSKK